MKKFIILVFCIILIFLGYTFLKENNNTFINEYINAIAGENYNKNTNELEKQAKDVLKYIDEQIKSLNVKTQIEKMTNQQVQEFITNKSKEFKSSFIIDDEKDDLISKAKKVLYEKFNQTIIDTVKSMKPEVGNNLFYNEETNLIEYNN